MMNPTQCMERVSALLFELWITANFDCLSIAIRLITETMAATNSASILQEFLTELHKLKSHFVKQRGLIVGGHIQKIVGDAMVAMNLAALENPSVLVKPKVEIDALSTVRELIDSSDFIDESRETTDNPFLEPTIAFIRECHPTPNIASSTDDIEYFHSIISGLTKHRDAFGIPPYRADWDKLLDARMVRAPWTPNESLDSVDSDGRVDEFWDTSDIPHLESIIALLLKSLPIDRPSAIEDIIYFRSIIVRMEERPSTLDKSPDTECTSDSKSIPACTTECCCTPEKSSHSIDCDASFDEVWGINDMPHLVSITIRLMESRNTHNESTATGDIVYFESIIIRLLERRTTPGEVPERSDHIVDAASAIAHIIGSEGTLDDGDDMVFFQSIIPLILESRSNPNESFDATDHNAGLLSDSVLKVELYSIALGSIDVVKSPDAIIDNTRIRSYEVIGGIAQLQWDITRTEEIIAAVLNQELKRGIAMYLSLILYQRYTRFGDLHDLERVIQGNEKLLSDPGFDSEGRRFTLWWLQCNYQDRFERLGNIQDIDRAIRLGEDEIAATAHDEPVPTYLLEKLCRSYKLRFERTSSCKDIDRAIQLCAEAIETRSHDSISYGLMLALSGYYNMKFKHFGNIEDAVRAILLRDETLAGTPDDSPNRSRVLAIVARNYESRWKQSGSTTDCESMILLYWEIINQRPRDSLWYDMIEVVSVLYSMRCERLANIEDADRAIRLAEEALAATPDDHSNRSHFLRVLGSGYRLRSLQTGSIKDGERAIWFGEEALRASPHQCPPDVFSMTELSNSCAGLFSRLGNMRDIDRAIQLNEAGMAATPQSDPLYWQIAYNLAVFYIDRFDWFGAVDDLERSIRVLEAAVAVIPENCPHRLWLLTGLSTCYRAKCVRFNSLQDFQKGNRALEESLAATPLDNIGRVYALNGIGINYCARFIESEDPADLDRAIQKLEEAMATTAVGHHSRAVTSINLGVCLKERCRLSMNPEDNDKALKLCEEAVAATPLDHPLQAKLLRTLSSQLDYVPIGRQSGALQVVLGRCFQAVVVKLGILVEESEHMTKQLAQPVDPEQPTEVPQLISDLLFFDALKTRFEATVTSRIGGVEADELFDMAQQLDRRCSQSEFLAEVKRNAELELPNGLWYRSIARNAIFHRKGAVSNRDRSRDILLAAWNCQNSPPAVRIKAARSAGESLASACRWRDASDLLHSAVQILPQLTPQFLARDDHEYMLSQSTQLASDAVAMALQAGATASHCLGILELGRGIIMGLAINCRSDVSELQIKYPDICDRFNRLRIDIDSPLVGKNVDNHVHEGRRRRRVQAMKEIDEILISIRELPDFGGFQLAPSPKDLTGLAAHGPIVIFNTHDLRSDAIIVTSASIKSLPLPKMVQCEVEDRMMELPGLVRGKRSTWRPRNDRMAEILLWLWEVAVEPVLEELGDGISRVWWIGVGPLATAPFHAAGDHSRGSTRNTISRVISSYIPTIKALMYATQKKLDLNSQDTSILLVTMPTTPGGPAIPVNSLVKVTPSTHSTPAVNPTTSLPVAKTWKPLQNVAKEAAEIMGAVNGTRTTRMDCPTTTEVLASIPAYNVIHFACHGVSDPTSPSNSYLALCGDNPSEEGKLTVGTISNMNIQNAQVAYLSACSSALNRSARLADESIHIASGFQLAGFSHVLGTLWPSDDEACCKVAGEFYRNLFSGQIEGHRAVSAAFHNSVLKLREDLWNQPVKWVPFIHTGA